MTELITTDQISKMISFVPSARSAIASTYKLCGLINSFDDIENFLLKGAGLAAGTYHVYMVTVRQLYRFTDGLHPFQITLGHVEAFYDYWDRKVSRRSVGAKISALKRFFKGVEEAAPLFRSPFRSMPEKLRKKFSRTGKHRTKKALTQGEVKDMLEYLQEAAHYSPDHAENYALVLMLVTSGLRAAELCQLKWSDIEFFEGKYTARFIGKGGDPAEQELYADAVEAAGEYFNRQFGRTGKTEPLFWTAPNRRTKHPVPMNGHALWARMKEIGRDLRAAGILTRELQFSPHLFRRTYATLLYSSGMKLKAIMQKTRHANIEILAKHYIDDEEPASPYFDRILN